MLALAEEVVRQGDRVAAVLDGRNRRAGGDPAHDGDRDVAAALFHRGRRGLGLVGKPAFDDARREALLPRRAADGLGQAENFQRAGAVGQAADEAASSSAVIRRWMPDLDLRSSASFISSNEGGTPDLRRRSWMKRSSSCCFASAWLAFTAPSRGAILKQSRNKVAVPAVFRKPVLKLGDGVVSRSVSSIHNFPFSAGPALCGLQVPCELNVTLQR